MVGSLTELGIVAAALLLLGTSCGSATTVLLVWTLDAIKTCIGIIQRVSLKLLYIFTTHATIAILILMLIKGVRAMLVVAFWLAKQMIRFSLILGK